MRRLPVGLELLLTAVPAAAGTLFGQAPLREVRAALPDRIRAAEGNTRTDSPWRRNGGAMRAMYVYGAEMLGHDRPVHIAGLAFRPDATQGSTNQATSFVGTIDLSTGVNPPGGLDLDFDRNHGADRTRTSRGGPMTIGALTLPVTSPREFVQVASFAARPFTWDPRLGPLVIDVQLQSSSGPGFLADAVSDGGESYARILHTSDGSAARANHGPERRAIAVQLLLASDVAPAFAAVAEGNAGSGMPWMLLAGRSARVQFAYDASVLNMDQPRRIDRLAWRLDRGQFPFAARTYDVRVTMSHGPAAASLSRTFAANHLTAPTVVFDGIWSPDAIATDPARTDPAGFDLVLPLQKTFTYDPERGSLLLDVQLRTATGPLVRATFDAVATGNPVELASVVHDGDWRAPVANAGPTAEALVTALPGVPQVQIITRSGRPPSPVPFRQASRIQSVYPRSILPPGHADRPIQITSLSWRRHLVTERGPSELMATVRLSTFTGTTLSFRFADNQGADVIEVCTDTAFCIPWIPQGRALTDITVHLDRPFTWDPRQGPLLVDVTSAAPVSGAGIDVFRSFHATDVRSVEATDPRAATGTTVTDVPDLVLGGDFSSNPRIRVEGRSCAPAGTRAMVTRIPELPTADFAFGVETDPGIGAFCTLGLTAQSIPLDFIGLRGCVMLTGGEITTLAHVTDASGVALQPLPLRPDPVFNGFRIFVQWTLVFPPLDLRLTERTEIIALR